MGQDKLFMLYRFVLFFFYIYIFIYLFIFIVDKLTTADLFESQPEQESDNLSCDFSAAIAEDERFVVCL